MSAKPLVYLVRSSGKRWKCQRPDRLRDELPELDPANDLPALHEAIETAGRTVWSIARRWFELQPMVPPADYDPVDLYTFATADELEASVGLKRGGLRQELGSVLGIWTAARPREADQRRAATAEKQARDEKFTGELPLTPPESPDETILKSGFAEVFSTVATQKLSSEQIQTEKLWFVGRIVAWRKALGDPQVATLARSLLIKEVLIRRIEHRLMGADLSLAGKETVEWVKHLRDEQTAYANLLQELDELAPWMGAVSGRVALQGVAADFIRLMQEYHASGDSQLVDGFFTATEIQILMTTCRQLPNPQYRPDIVVMVAEARQHLWNRDWRPHLTPGQFKRLSAAWTAAEAAVRQDLSLQESDREPDFLDSGPMGEFPELVPGPAGTAQ